MQPTPLPLRTSMATWSNTSHDNTDDENSHQLFLNSFLAFGWRTASQP